MEILSWSHAAAKAKSLVIDQFSCFGVSGEADEEKEEGCKYSKYGPYLARTKPDVGDKGPSSPVEASSVEVSPGLKDGSVEKNQVITQVDWRVICA
jgi:hypothetical protein